MTISLKHFFASSKGDPADTTLVKPSDWNHEHVLTLAGDSLVGKDTSSGPAIEIPCGAFMRTLLAATDLPSLLAAMGIGAFTTGDAKLTYKVTADAGWLMMDDGTVGDASSAGTHADASYLPIFTFLYNTINPAYITVSGGARTSLAADWAAHKTIQLPRALGRALAVAGAGSGLSGRDIAQFVGEETHVNSLAELPSFTMTSNTFSLNTPDVGPQSTNTAQSGVGATFITSLPIANTYTLGAHTQGTTISVPSGGSGAGHNNMQPTSFLNVMIKL